MKRKLYITLLGLLSTIMTAAVPYCDVRKFSITDGLAANTISDLKQGKDNLMWFSTWNGLSFYDGYKFHTFRDNPDDIDVLSTNRILKIEPSYNNNVWCITYDHKLYVYDTHFCRFFAVGQKFNELFNIDLRVSQVYPMKNGATWFTSEDGKYIIRSVGKTFDERNIELIKVGKRDSEAEMYGTSIKIYTEENGCLPTKAHAYTTRNFQANCLSNGSEGWEKMSSWQLKTVNWQNMTCRTDSP